MKRRRTRKVAAAIPMLKKVGDTRLITNNPSKVDALRYGVKLRDVVPLQTGLTEYNERCFETKRDRFGHHLDLGGK